MAPLPPYMAKLIAPDDFEERKYFDSETDAVKWVLGAGKNQFDGDVQRAEIYHFERGLVWFKDRLKVEDDVRYRQMRADPNSKLRFYGIPQPRPKPHITAYCTKCEHETLHWREYEEWAGIMLQNKPLRRCSECYQVIPDPKKD